MSRPRAKGKRWGNSRIAPGAGRGRDPGIVSTSPEKTPRVGFTPKEIRVFRIYAVIVAAIAASMAVVAPKGPGQVLGALFAVALLPIPPLVVYLRRRRQKDR